MKKESTAAVVKKEPKAKKGGVKRSMRGGNSNDDGPNNTTATTKQQPSKRSKKTSDTIAHKGTTTAIVTAPRTTRSRSRSSSARRGSSSKSNSNNKKVMRPFRAVEIVQPPTDNRIIPHDFGLKRDSFNGQNFTYGIAHYDAAKKSDPQLCSGLVTDLFQQLFHAEVRRRVPYPLLDILLVSNDPLTSHTSIVTCFSLCDLCLCRPNISSSLTLMIRRISMPR